MRLFPHTLFVVLLTSCGLKKYPTPAHKPQYIQLKNKQMIPQDKNENSSTRTEKES